MVARLGDDKIGKGRDGSHSLPESPNRPLHDSEPPPDLRRGPQGSIGGGGGVESGVSGWGLDLWKRGPTHTPTSFRMSGKMLVLAEC